MPIKLLRRRRELREILADVELIAVIREAVCDAEVDAINDNTGRFRTASHRGVRAHQQGLLYLGSRLDRLGFYWKEATNQVRLCSSEAQGYEHPFRLLLVRGQKVTDHFILGAKGVRTTELVKENSLAANRQLTLDLGDHAEDEAEEVLNVFIVVEQINELEICCHLVVPTEIRVVGGKTKFCNIADQEVIFEGELTSHMELQDRATESDEIEIELKER